MTTLRLLFVALTASALLTSCGGHFDSRYPSIAQQDSNDLAWGLPARKSRGNPKLRMQYDARNDALRSSAQAPAAPSVPQISPSPEAAAPAPVSPRAPAPAVPSGLR